MWTELLQQHVSVSYSVDFMHGPCRIFAQAKNELLWVGFVQAKFWTISSEIGMNLILLAGCHLASVFSEF